MSDGVAALLVSSAPVSYYSVSPAVCVSHSLHPDCGGTLQRRSACCWPGRCERRAAWPQVRQREIQSSRLLLEVPQPASKSNPWLLLRNFISESERAELLSSADRQRKQGLLLPNPAGPNRFFRKLDATGGVDDLVEALTDRLEKAVIGLTGQPRDPTLGRVCSYIEPGGYIHEHRDKYTGETGYAHLRANIVVQMVMPSGLPIIAGRPVPVREGDAWVFLASHELHSTEVIQGNNPRIVFGFGWTVPEAFSLEQKHERGS
eukprot:TRINITY_DN27161_c0_g1_i2.p1 TRINITY_DN27161_c0_g1~~TRINITY_DN27161_c0_g1_i2.p1  ORF type:complete len:261 (-),score=34.33 TRINITY_DN27161_c0_g1_i2:310-1092(-)